MNIINRILEVVTWAAAVGFVLTVAVVVLGGLIIIVTVLL